MGGWAYLGQASLEGCVQGQEKVQEGLSSGGEGGAAKYSGVSCLPDPSLCLS